MRASPALSLSLTIPLPLASTRTRFFTETLRLKQHVSDTQTFSRPVPLVSKQPPSIRWTFSCKCRNRGRNSHAKFDDEGEDFIVVNFYRFVSIQDPSAEIAKHLSFLQVPFFRVVKWKAFSLVHIIKSFSFIFCYYTLQDLNIRGRIYLNEQGINAQVPMWLYQSSDKIMCVHFCNSCFLCSTVDHLKTLLHMLSGWKKMRDSRIYLFRCLLLSVGMLSLSWSYRTNLP